MGTFDISSQCSNCAAVVTSTEQCDACGVLGTTGEDSAVLFSCCEVLVFFNYPQYVSEFLAFTTKMAKMALIADGKWSCVERRVL
jgi:hypothetical protein